MNIAFAVVKHIERGGGIEKYTAELGTRLVEMGHDVKVYSMKNYGTVSSTYNGMQIISIPCISLRQMEKLSASQIAGIMLAFEKWPDIVHFHSISTGSAAWMSKLSGKNTVIQMHGLEWKRSRWGKAGSLFLHLLEKWSLLTKSNLTAVSKVQCEYFKHKYDLSVKYIPTGVDVKKKIKPAELLKLGLKPRKYILFASRLVKEKGAHYLIPAFRRINTAYRLVVAGDVPNEDKYKNELLKLAEGDERIVFPGFVEGRLLEELFSNAAFYVQPSEIEGLSIALLEAMSYGLPCLVSDIPENREAIGTCGLTFKSKDVADLRRNLESMLRNEDNIALTAEKAIQRVKTNYSWDNIAREFNDFYHSILSKQS